MRKFNRLLPGVTLVCVAALPTFVRAQASAGGGGAYLQKINSVLDDLKLTADEKSKIDDVLHDAREDGTKLKSEVADLSPQERQEKVRNFVTGLNKKIDAQLTQEQAKQFDAKMSDGAGRADAPTPGNAVRPGLAGRRGGGGAGGRIEQLKTAIDKLDLSDDQKTKIKTMFDDLKPKAAALRDADPQERREKAMSLMSDMRSKLAEILTPEQLQSLRESMQNGGKAGATTQPAVASAKQKMGMMMNGDDAGMQMAAGGANTPAAKPAAPAKASTAGYAVGQTPADVKLARLDQSPVNLSAYKGRVVALVFGSYSCPMFREHAADLNKLGERLGSNAAVILVYTRESNPAGGWQPDSNKKANVSVKQTVDIPDRSVAAQMTRDVLHLAIPVVVDDKNDTLATAFGVLPNGCVVLNRTGAIAAKFHWFEPISTQHAIDEALASPVVMSSPADGTDLR